MALTPSGDFTRYLAQNYYTKTELQAGALSTIYFTESEHIATSAGAGDAGKPIKLNGSGVVDSTMLAGGSVATHAALTAAHGATGAVVGTTNTQTLTNKTLTTPTISSPAITGDFTGSGAANITGQVRSDTSIRVRQSGSVRYRSELGVGSGIATFNAYDDTGTVYIPMEIVASTLTFGNGTAGTTQSSFDASGNLAVAGTITAGGVAVPTISSSSTLTNKTLTSPVIATIVNSGTLTLPTSTDTLVGRATTDTLTNKTLTSPTMTTPTMSSPIITTSARVQQSGAARYRSDWSVGSETVALNGFDDTGSVYLPLEANFSTISLGLSGTPKVVISGTTTAVTGTLTVSTAISVNSVAVPTISSTSTLTNKTLTDPLIGRVYGGSAANDDVTIEGTSHATRTTSYVKIQPNGGKTVVGGSDADHDFEVQNRADDDYRITFNLNSTGSNYINSYSTTTGGFTGAPLNIFSSRLTVDTGRLNLGINTAPTTGVTAGVTGDIIVAATKIWVCTDGATSAWKGVTIA